MGNILNKLVSKANQKDFREYLSLLVGQEGRIFPA